MGPDFVSAWRGMFSSTPSFRADASGRMWKLLVARGQRARGQRVQELALVKKRFSL